MSEISLRNVTKSYGEHLALPGLNLDVAKRSFVTLLGPSGCGKTTTLRVIAGLETTSGGEVVVAGQTVDAPAKGTFVPPERRGLGFIFQSYALWPNMKVDRNITLALSEQKMRADDIRSRLTEALEKVQLTGLSDRYPSELSGGQQQRVAVARLIAARNSILLMDEPLSNLDAKLRTEMRTELKRLHRDLQATTVYVTHDQVEALTMSDVIVVMKDGVIQQQGSPYDIYHEPANLFVAEFIGDPRINLLEGVVAMAGRHRALDITGTGIVLPLVGTDATPGSRIVAAIRPENIVVHAGSHPGAVEAQVDVVQPTGSQTILSVSIDDRRLTILVPRFERRVEGGRLWLECPREHVRFFDPASGRRLALATLSPADAA